VVGEIELAKEHKGQLCSFAFVFKGKEGAL